MSRSRTYLIIVVDGLGLLLLLTLGFLYQVELHPRTSALGLLTVLCLLHFLLPLSVEEFAVLLLTLVPGSFFGLHFLSGLPLWEAYLLIAKCCLIMFLYLALYRMCAAPALSRLKTILQLSLSLAVPVLAGVILLRLNMLFLFVLPAVLTLILFYRRNRPT